MSRLWRYCLAGLVCDWLLYVVFLVIAFRAEEQFHASEAMVGLLLAVDPALYAVSCLLAGVMSDRISRPLLVRVGCVLLAVGFVLVAFVNSLVALFLCMPLIGFSRSLFWPPVQAAIGAESTSDDLEKNLGLFNILWSVGKGLGFFTAGVLTGVLGPRWTVLLAAGASVSICFFYPWKEPRGMLAEKRRLRAEERPDRVAFLKIGWVANFVAFGVGAILAAHLYKYLNGNNQGAWMAGLASGLGLRVENPSQFLCGVVLATLYVTQTLTFVVLRYTRRWTYRRSLLYGIQIVMGAGGAAFAFSLPESMLLVLALIVGIGLGYGYASSIYYSLHTPKSHGKYSGIHEAFLGAGHFIGPILAGALASGFGDPRASWWLCGAVMLAAIVIQEVIYRRWRYRREPGEEAPGNDPA